MHMHARVQRKQDLAAMARENPMMFEEDTRMYAVNLERSPLCLREEWAFDYEHRSRKERTRKKGGVGDGGRVVVRTVCSEGNGKC